MVAVVNFVAVVITRDDGVAGVEVDAGDTGVVDAVELASDVAVAGVSDDDCVAALAGVVLVPLVSTLTVVPGVAGDRVVGDATVGVVAELD